MAITICSIDDWHQVEKLVEQISSFLKLYQYISNAHILEFFNEKQWDLLPSLWRSFLDSLSNVQLIQFLEFWTHESIQTNSIPPLSLLAFRVCVRTYSLNRKATEQNEMNKIIKRLIDDRQSMPSDKTNSNTPIHLPIVTTKHMTPKKQHEIVAFVSLLERLFHNQQNQKLVDFGSGKGHLARVLSLNNRFRVFTVEKESDLRSKAEQYDQQLIKMRPFQSVQSPKHLLLQLDHQNLHMLESFLQDSNDLAMVGLHSCGQLAVDMLNYFQQSCQMKWLSLCFCCWHKTPTNRCLMSEPANLFMNQSISVETRANACHSIEQLVQTLKCDPNSLNAHAYRSILEHIFKNEFPQWRKKTLAKVRSVNQLSFPQFVRQATRKLDAEEKLSDELLQRTLHCEKKLMNLLNQRHRVLIFYCLRTMLGPLIETLMLLDRLLFVCKSQHSHSVRAAVLPVFDSSISARCFVLIARKC